MTINILGIDLVEWVFKVHGADETSKTMLKSRFNRSPMSAFWGHLPPTVRKPVRRRTSGGAIANLSGMK